MTGDPDPRSGVQSDGTFVPVFPGQRPPFAQRHQASRRHGFYATKLSLAEAAEVGEIAEAIRELAPANDDRLEPLVAMAAAQTWRLRRAYADLDAHGIVRGESRSAAPLLRHIEAAERALLETLRALALTPQAAADLGLTMLRADAERYDFAQLESAERSELERLLAKAERRL